MSKKRKVNSKQKNKKAAGIPPHADLPSVKLKVNQEAEVPARLSEVVSRDTFTPGKDFAVSFTQRILEPDEPFITDPTIQITEPMRRIVNAMVIKDGPTVDMFGRDPKVSSQELFAAIREGIRRPPISEPYEKPSLRER